MTALRFDRSPTRVAEGDRHLPGGVSRNFRLGIAPVRALERGAWFLSTAHDDAVIDTTIEAVRATANGTLAAGETR